MSGIIRIIAVAVFVAPLTANATLITYNLVNAPSVQNGRTLSGFITVDTTQTTPLGGGFWISDSSTTAITAWSFSVSGGAELPYAVSSSDSGARYGITGPGTYSIEATSTGLFIPSASSLVIGTGSPSFLDFVNWDHGASGYASARGGNISPRGWATFDSTALNTAFGGGATWQIAAVPEPSTSAMALAGVACGGYSLFRRRQRA